MTDAILIDQLRTRAATDSLPDGQTCVVACTLYGEARGVGPDERHGIANTIGNRVRARRRDWGLTPADVCLARWQYSCWTPAGGVANYEQVLLVVQRLLSGAAVGPLVKVCLALAADVVCEALPDIVSGSTHYVTRALFVAHPPVWAAGRTPTVVIGSTAFFAGVA